MNLSRRISLAYRALTQRAVEKDAAFNHILGMDTGTVSSPVFNESNLDAFEKVAVVYACVRKKAFDLARVPLLVEVKSGKKNWTLVEPGNKAFGDVAGVFQKINPEMGKTELWVRFQQSMELQGEAFLHLDYLTGELKPGAKRPASQTPKELWNLRADDMQIEKGDNRRRLGYLRISDRVRFRPDEILHHRYPHPANEWRGFPPLAAAKLAALTRNATDNYQFSFFKRGARPSLAIKVKKSMNDEKMREIAAGFNRDFTGPDGAFKIMLLNEGFDVEDLGSGRRDTDFSELNQLTKEEICMAFGVPPALLGRSETDHNIDEQMPMYWEGTIIPNGELLEENLTEMVGPRFDPEERLRFRFAWDSVPAIQRMMANSAKVYVELVGGPFMAPNEARERAHLEPLPGMDEVREPQAPPAFGEPRPAKVRKGFIDTPERHEKRVRAKEGYEAFEVPAEREVERFFDAEEARVLAHVREREKGMNGNTVQKLTQDDIFDEQVEVEAARKLVARIYSRVVARRGPEAVEEVGGSAVEFLIDAPEVLRFIDKNAYSVGVLLTQTTREAIAKVLLDANAGGLTVNELTSRLRAAFDIRKAHAQTIARTEILTAYNFTTTEAWAQSGVVEGKEWLSSGDEKVRSYEAGDEFDHTQNDGDVVPLNSTFTISGEELAYPGDPGASAGNRCNCRCACLPVIDVTKARRPYRVAPGLLKILSRAKDSALTD